MLRAGTGAGARATTRAMRSRMTGVGVEQMFYTLQAGMFYTFRGVSSRTLVRGNVLHLHLICANNDDKHGARGGQRAARPPDVQRADVPVANILLLRRVLAHGFDREGFFDEAAVVVHQAAP